MKRAHYIGIAACLAIGILGFVGVYAWSHTKENDVPKIASDAQQDTETEESEAKVEEIVITSQQVRPIEESVTIEEKEETPQVVETITQQVLHFSPENGMNWPLEGNVLIGYSMDATVYFKTLDQYRYNPAIIIGGNINSEVYFVAKGKIIDISTNEETGCTIRQDLGDGYTAIYGQIKEPQFEVGDMVEGGQVVGYVSEPTKYYAMEGSNLYFAMEKDGVPVNPLDYFD